MISPSSRLALSGLLVALALTLTACGAGGGESGSGGAQPPPTNDPPAFSTTATVAVGDGFSLALRNDGLVFAWGDQQLGSLGNDSTSASSQRVPQQVINLARIQSIAAGQYHGLALRQDGAVFAWGPNTNARLGLGSVGGIFARAQQVPGVTNAVAVAAGFAHSLALLADGRVLAWGDNQSGQLGVGDFADRSSATQVSGITSARAIFAGAFHSGAVLADGTVRLWGNNADGQLGLGDKADRNTPAAVAALAGSNITQLSGGQFHTLARDGSGAVWAWGANVDGQIGTVQPTPGADGDTTVPARITSLSTATVVAAGHRHSTAVLSDGTVRAWGRNLNGQLGNGASTNQPTSLPQVMQANTVKAIAAGANHTVLIVQGGIVGCTGSNFLGQCGRGDFTTDTTVPVEVGPGFDLEP
jgi:alpha-tubulin suppressor-like RCC1 family protein